MFRLIGLGFWMVTLAVASSASDEGLVDVSQPLGGGPLPAEEQLVLFELLSSPETPPLLESDPVFQAQRLVVQWAESWSRQDVATYLGFYSQDFEPTASYADYTVEEWRMSRRDRIRNPEWVRVAVSDLAVSLEGERAVVRFMQDYASDSFSDWVIKELTLRREGGLWRILLEESRQP